MSVTVETQNATTQSFYPTRSVATNEKGQKEFVGVFKLKFIK